MSIVTDCIYRQLARNWYNYHTVLFPHSTILRNGDFSPGNVALLASNYFESRPQGAMWIVDPVVRSSAASPTQKMQSNYLRTKRQTAI